MTNSIIPPSRFREFNGLYAKVYDDSLWGFHEAATDILKGSNLLTLPKKNKGLNQVIENYINSLDSANDRSSSLGDFYQQRNLMHI